jgi:Ser/Thr protein kinase RdoA (MazF antagonist)
LTVPKVNYGVNGTPLREPPERLRTYLTREWDTLSRMRPTFDFAAAVRMATGGSVPRTMQLTGDANETHVAFLSDERRLVIRILRFSDAERARQEAPVQHALAAAGIVTPISLVLDHGDIVGRVSGLDFTASWFIEGQHPTTVSAALECDIGRTLETFHRATNGLTVDGTGWLNPLHLDKAIQAVHDVEFRRTLEGMRPTADELFGADLPIANIHGDLWPGNLFARGGRVTAVLDLETVEAAPRILDIGRAAVAVVAASTRSPTQALRSLAAAYDAGGRLTQSERDLLPAAYNHAAVASAAWNIETGHADQAHETVRRALARPPV